MASVQKVPTAPFNPFYGCAIMVMAACIFFGIIGWSLYSLVTQDKEIAKITVPEPIQLPPVEITPEAKATLDQKLQAFAEKARAHQPAELSLTIADLNAIIATAPDTGYGSYASLLRVTSTLPEKDGVIGDVCLPLNNIKFWEDKKRYLIGQLTWYMHVHEEGLDAKVVDVKVPGKDVPEGFITGMEIWPWIAPYRKVEPIGTILKAIRQVKVTPEGLWISSAAPTPKS